MAHRTRSFIVSAALTAGILLLSAPMQISPASAQSAGTDDNEDCTKCNRTPTSTDGTPTPASTGGSPTPTPTPTPTPSPTPIATPTPTPTPSPSPTGADNSAGSVNDLAKQRFNQMITNR